MNDTNPHHASGLHSHARPLLAEWERAPVERCLPPALVHKARAENVALARVAALEIPHRFLSQVCVRPTHPFFFDHPLDHLPGMLLIEAARQFGVAVAHRFYDVPADTHFSLSGMRVDFTRFAELDSPTFILGAVEDRVSRRGKLQQMTFTGGFVNRGQQIGEMSGT